jgi:hypothetical protein
MTPSHDRETPVTSTTTDDPVVDDLPVGPYEPWITDPGHYPELTDDEYHADPVVGGSLSSTGARALLPPGCPARFDYDRRNGRADRAVFDYGRAAHAVVLGTGAPIAMLPFDDRRSKAYKEAAAGAREQGKTPLLERDAVKVFEMADALLEHPIAGPLLSRPGAAEQSYVARDPASGVMCRIRVDFLPTIEPGGRVILVDYKTTANAYPPAFARSAFSYGYHQQGDFYRAVLRWLGLADDRAEFVIVAQEKEPPYLVSVLTFKPRAMEWAEVLNRKARDVYRHCTADGHWPGYEAGPVELDLPGWLDHAYDLADLAGEYDPIGDAE